MAPAPSDPPPMPPDNNPIDSEQPRRRAWNDAPLKNKLGLLLFAAVLLGVGMGLAAGLLGHTPWVLLVGLALVPWALTSFARSWIAEPFLELLDRCHQLDVKRSPEALRQLPVHREDEAGRIARAIHHLGVNTIRGNYESNRLRRTMDHRVEQEIKRATRQLTHLAMRDSLTNLGNRRFLEENLGPLVKSVLDSDGTLACLAIDLDNFKSVNDKLGHAAGDELLVFLASLIRTSIRAEDYAVRLGGDEFILLLPNCSAQRVGQIAEHMRKLFRQHARAAFPSHCQADLSIGVAVIPGEDVLTGEQLLQQADKKLYAAKHAGKGRTVGV